MLKYKIPQIVTLTPKKTLSLYPIEIHKEKTPKIIDFQSLLSIYFSDSYTLRDSNPGPTD